MKSVALVLPLLALAVIACGGASSREGSLTSDDEPAALGGITAAHNAVRAQVDPAPATPLTSMTWSGSAAATAQDWANQCNFDHNPNRGNFGENIAFFSGDGSALQAVDLWSGEASHYDYDSNSCAGAQCGHYTQIVWADTTKLGCGVATCNMLGGSGQLVVCDYDPPGNFIGERPY